jgi:ABC-2 type transport system ATP-binding protein
LEKLINKENIGCWGNNLFNAVVEPKSSIIEVSNLVETYPSGTQAVRDISFTVRQGEIFGFLGPNGAGKSTTIKILTTLLHKTSGKVTIGGYNLDTKAGAIRKIIGVQSQETVLDDDLTAKENLVLQGQLQQMSADAIKKRVDELLNMLSLADVADKRTHQFSGGMRKRLDLASALVHKPNLLFLDEPTTGLDPQSRLTVWEYLTKLNQEEGITIFLTTQYMEEADRLCKELCIIDNGVIVAQGSPSELKREIGADSIKLNIENNSQKEQTNAKAKQILTNLPAVDQIIESEEGLTLYAKNASSIVADIVRTLDREKIKIASVSFSSPNLDDVFLKHTGKRIRPEVLTKKPPQGGGLASRSRRRRQ